MDNDILWFKKIDQGVHPFLGEKSKTIALLYINGYPIPHGFIIPAKLYNKFLEKTQIKDTIRTLMQNIDAENKEDIQSKANEIQRIILTTEIPTEIKNEIIESYKSLDVNESRVRDFLHTRARDMLVAVRNDPVPGYKQESLSNESKPLLENLHLSFLNIRGDKMLIKTVQACWASLYTAKAIELRAKNNISQIFCAMSVIIQRMLPLRKSGTILTSSPNAAELSTIKACLGVMKNPNGKEADFSTYLIDHNSMEIKQKDVHIQTTRFVYDEDESKYLEEDITLLPNRNPLIDSEVTELAIFGKHIENFFGLPQEISWGYFNKFFILNSTPLILPASVKPIQEQILESVTASNPGAEIIKTHEEVEVLLDEKTNNIIVKEHIEVKGEVKEKTIILDPNHLLEESKNSIISAFNNVHGALEHALRTKEKDDSSDIKSLLDKQDYAHKHELELILNLKEEFLKQKEVSLEDLKHSMDAVKKFIDYLKEHKLI